MTTQLRRDARLLRKVKNIQTAEAWVHPVWKSPMPYRVLLVHDMGEVEYVGAAHQKRDALRRCAALNALIEHRKAK